MTLDGQGFKPQTNFKMDIKLEREWQRCLRCWLSWDSDIYPPEDMGFEVQSRTLATAKAENAIELSSSFVALKMVNRIQIAARISLKDCKVVHLDCEHNYLLVV